jgi:hypothetical protein
VGSQHGEPPGPYDFADTPEKVMHYWREMHPAPHDPVREKTLAALQRSRERDAKQAADAEYKQAYSDYVEQCRQRRQRIDDARRTCEATIQEARQLLRAVEAEPVPQAPVKRQ